MIHIKDQGYLGQGSIDFRRFLESVLKSGYRGWLNLETRILKTAAEDFAANARFVRGVLKELKAP
jgi:sugar phosphate isomerase/epimerase